MEVDGDMFYVLALPVIILRRIWLILFVDWRKMISDDIDFGTLENAKGKDLILNGRDFKILCYKQWLS